MKHLLCGAAVLAALAAMPAGVSADTLYVSGPAAARALRLGPDHRASQVGDLIAVSFDFAVTSASSNVVKNTKGYSVGLTPGTGNAALGFLRFPTAIGGQTGLQTDHTKNGSNAFVSNMMARVVAVLPSGVMQIEGDQRLIVNGQDQILHVTGYVRPEDVDPTDTVLSTRIAGVKATFSGNFQENKGLIRRILDFLF